MDQHVRCLKRKNKSYCFNPQQEQWQNFPLHSQLFMPTLLLRSVLPHVTTVTQKRPQSFCIHGYSCRFWNFDTQIFCAPRMGRRTQGERSFQYIGPVIWNSLPVSSRHSSSLSSFKSKLKTHLFSSAYWSVIFFFLKDSFCQPNISNACIWRERERECLCVYVCVCDEMIIFIHKHCRLLWDGMP